MSLFAEPRVQVFDENGKPIEGAKMYFFAIGTSTLKTIYSDSNNTAPQANPATSDAEGRFPAIFLDGLYKVVLKNNGTTIYTQDPVGDVSSAAFSLWANDATYNIPDIVLGSDDNYYRSIVDANQGNDPVSSPLSWEPLLLLNNSTQTIAGDKTFSGATVFNGSVNLAGGVSISGTVVTSTATEINQLHLSAVTQADFIKLHAVTSSATQLDYAPVGTFYTDSGTANSYVLSPISTWTTPPSYFNGFVFAFLVANTNTGASTATPGALTGKNIFMNGAALTGGELVAGAVAVLRYNLSADRFDLEFSYPNFVSKFGNQSMAGNLAVAGTNRSWGNDWKVIDLGNTAALALRISNGQIFIVKNLYHDNTDWRYITTDVAGLLFINTGGGVNSSQAISGTAGTVATSNLTSVLAASTGLFTFLGNSVQIVPTAVSGFSGGGYQTLANDGAPVSFLNLVSVLVNLTWESVGPTGSGAANIWSAMDSIASGASSVKFVVNGFAVNTVAGSSHTLYGRRTGSAATASVYTMIYKVAVYGVTGNEESETASWAEVPLDSSRRFDLYRDTVNASTLQIMHKGWGI